MNEYFFEQMRELLGERYDEFKRAYDGKPRFKALRVNTLKISAERFSDIFRGELKANPLCSASFYCDVKPSLDPLYHAGLYYMQEPSASAAVAAFAPYIGERVLDLCAAPGGKATQAAASMNGGVIFCNDPEYKRVRALAENIERLGVRNAVVTCNTAADYRAAGFDGYFDTLIVDAPCSGGGMMRYENVVYDRDTVSGCAARQRAILKDAVRLLCGGGYMLYSTCTFSCEENEDNIGYLRTLGLTPVETPLLPCVERGVGENCARRIYLHNFDGEGHFYCVLKKPDGEVARKPLLRSKRKTVKIGGMSVDAIEIDGRTVLPIAAPELFGLNAVRIGAPVSGDRGAPTQALLHALDLSELSRLGAVELSADDARRYIGGEQLDIRAPRDTVVATYKGFALGGVRSAPTGDGASALKNLYPKNLRVR
ncbi:MAG: hypothetical protein NC184_06080 [Roseburia sp.]|nr:hypothetical protein [Roseburia sp.]